MKTLIFTVYDQKIERYLTPFHMHTVGQALRAWTDMVNDPQTAFYKHPTDYTLFEIGIYDDEKACFENYITPKSVGTALEFQKAPETYPQIKQLGGK